LPICQDVTSPFLALGIKNFPNEKKSLFPNFKKNTIFSLLIYRVYIYIVHRISHEKFDTAVYSLISIGSFI